MVITASTPAAAAMRRNSLLRGMSRRNSHDAPYQSASSMRNVPSPTMTSQARWTVLT